MEHKKCPENISEMHDNFCIPESKKKLTTRAKRLEQFFWQEFYNEYIRNNDRLLNQVIPNENTEYFDQFCKNMPPEDEDRKKALINKYPLYCTTAITLWNHQGDITKQFKKKYSITRPIQECTEKFAL